MSDACVAEEGKSERVSGSEGVKEKESDAKQSIFNEFA